MISVQDLVEQPGDVSEFPYAEVIRDVAVRRAEQRATRERQAGKKEQYFFSQDQQQDQWDRRNQRKRANRGSNSTIVVQLTI